MCTCYICNSKLTKSNQSKEHIFLNAAGGRLQSKYLLCNNCNSEFGQKCDSDLSKQLNVWANLFNIKRQRGKPQDIIVETQNSDDKIVIQPGGNPKLAKPTVKKEKHEKLTRYSITVNNKKQAQTILKGIKKTHPELDIEKAINSLKEVIIPINKHITHLKFSIGGNNEFRSICKTAINFFLLNNGDKKYIEHLIPYVKSEVDLNKVWFYYPDQEIIDYDKNSEILHSIIIIGDNHNKIIYAYVEYFSAYKFIVLISEKYNGEDFKYSHFYNVVDQIEDTKSFQLQLNPHEIKDIVKSKHFKMNRIKENIAQLQVLVHRKQHDEMRNKVIDDAIKETFGELPEGAIITEEIISKLASNVVKGMLPLLPP